MFGHVFAIKNDVFVFLIYKIYSTSQSGNQIFPKFREDKKVEEQLNQHPTCLDLLNKMFGKSSKIYSFKWWFK